jgi:ribosomal-protein-alanine acetyltransferase
MTPTIEHATTRQLDRLYEIEKECFQKEAFTKRQIAYLLSAYNSVSLVAKVNSEIIGFIISVVILERNALVGHILTLEVLPQHRRKGIAQQLLQEIDKILKEKGVKACRLEVRENNLAALKLYQKLGYLKVAKLKDYYGNAHGIYLRKDLT